MEDLIAIKKTLKIMLEIAKGLSSNNSPYVYELGHYLADNLLTKICLTVAIEKGKKNLIYRKEGNKFTKDLKDLYNDILKSFSQSLPDYNDYLKSQHEQRNIYQHRIDSLELTIRQPQAEGYVNYIENIMKRIGYIGDEEVIYPSSLLSGTVSYNYEKAVKEKQTTKYQKLYNLFNSKDNTDLHIKFRNIINEIGIPNLSKTLIMEGGRTRYTVLYFHNSFWSIEIFSQGISIRSEEMKKSFSFDELEKNRDVLNKFLQYFRDSLKKIGIEIKK